MLPQWHVKDPCHSVKIASGNWHLNTHTPTKSEWADYVAVQVSCGNLSGNELTRNSSGNTKPQSSQLAERMRTDPGLKSGISVRELIFTLKKKNARREWMNGRTFSPNSRKQGKCHYFATCVRLGYGFVPCKKMCHSCSACLVFRS